MNWQSAVERTVTGLGYDLVDAEKSAGGLLRVFIDCAPSGPDGAAPERSVSVDDCEKVTRQLQHVLEVEGCAYERLEVSSPGLDRPLKKASDYRRFVGELVELTLKEPFQGRKRWRGELQPAGDRWRVVLAAEPARKATAKRAAVSKPRPAVAADAGSAADQALEFALDEVREARLVPVVDFKGRRLDTPGVPAGEPAHDEVDGGRIQ